MSNGARKLARPRGVEITARKWDGTIVERKSRDGWWANRAHALNAQNIPATPPKSPLDRRIARAIKKATSP
jgi:hypothetical protein